MMIYQKITFCLLLLFSSLSVMSLSASALDKKHFIELVKQTPGYEEIALQVNIAEQQKNIYGSGEDWLLSLGVSQSERDGADNLLSSNDADTARTLSAGLSRSVFATGGELSIAQQWTKNEYDKTDGNDYHNNQFSAEYSHPLLKNKGGVVSALNRDLSSYDLQMAKFSAQVEEQNFIVEKITLFLNWVQYQQQLDINQQQLILTNKQLARTERKYNNKLVNEVDVLLQKDLVFTREHNILTIKQSLNGVKKTLAELFNNANIMGDKAELNLDNIANLKQINTLENTAKFKHLKLDIARSKRYLQTLINEEQAELDLTLSLTREGENEGGANAFSDVSNDYTMALAYQYPLGNREANSERFKAELELQEKELIYRQQLADDRAQMNSLEKRMQMLEAQIKLADKRIKNAVKTTKQQQERYDNAHIDVSFVIDALDNEQQIKLAKISYQIDYHQTYYDYALMLDRVE